MKQSSGLHDCNFIKKETPTRVFSCEYSKSFRNSFFYGTIPLAAFIYVLVSERILKEECYWWDCLWFNWLVSCTNTKAYKHVNYHKSVCLSCKICWILLSQNIWSKKSMMTEAFAWMNKAPVTSGDMKIYQCHMIKR